MTTEQIELPEVEAPRVPTFTREDAISSFKELIAKHGVRWTAAVPAESYQKLAECNKWLTELDRRELLAGNPVT